MNFIRLIYTIIFSLFCSAMLFSCTDDIQYTTEGESYSIVKGNKVEVHLKVNLDNSGADRLRTRDDSRPNDGFHNPDYSNPGIGGGTLATTLIYQLYDEEGNSVALPNPDSSSDIIGLHQVRVENRRFPYSDIVFTVDNGRKYTMIFWAQSGEEDNVSGIYHTKGDWFYDTDDLKNIIVRYDSQDEDGNGQLNNTDSRDAFCAKVQFTGGQPLPEVTLRRVMAQVNIGFTRELSERLERSNVDIQKSSIWIANVGRRFNLYKNQVELFSSGDETDGQDDGVAGVDAVDETGKGGITWPFTMGAYNINTIPKYMEYPDKAQQGDNILKVGDQEYQWVSMCYILAPGETDEEWVDDVSVPIDHGSTVDIVNIQFFDKNNVAYNLPLTEMLNVPVKRNYRTNILVDKLFNATITMDAEIGPDTYDDFGYQDAEIIDGELSPGLTYRVRPGMSANWGGTTYSNGFEFYVSSVQGLKWLADRSNGLDFKLRDIPEWMIKKEGWENLSKKEKLYAYQEKVFDIIFGPGESPSIKRTMLSYYDKGYAYRNEYGYRTPWTFDDCVIYLSNDLDFNEAPDDIKNDWHGFSCNMSYYDSSHKGTFNGEWYMTPNPDGSYGEISNPKAELFYSSTQTNYFHGFKGEFDGQGYTIYNMVINNLNDFYETDECTGKKVYGPRKLHNAGFICTAKDKARIKNLRLYNAFITGDYNIGGFVGYHESSTLTITNCRFVNSRIEGAEPQRYSPSDDANVGGIAGSMHDFTIQNCQVVNCDIISTFIGGAFVGIPAGAKNFTNNKVYNTNVILTELNNVGTVNGSVPRTGSYVGNINDPSFFYGTTAYRDISSFDGDKGDSSINAFYGIKYSAKSNAENRITQSAIESQYGKSFISNLPLDLFPDILTKYAQNLTLETHITGSARSDGNNNYGLKIDISGQPKDYDQKNITNFNNVKYNDYGFPELKSELNSKQFEYGNKWYFTLAGTTYESQPLDGQTQLGEKYSRQHVLLVSPNGLTDVKGVYVCAPDVPPEAERHVTVRDVIIAGEPSIKYGLYLDNVKNMYLDHVAVYDVENAFADGTVPSGASFRTFECDFRGITNVGKGYSTVSFENTAFNKGSGQTENVIGRLYAKSSATFKGCMFRVDYKIIVENEAAVLTFEDCICGPPYNQVKLTKENFWKYMESTDERPFKGKVKFSGDNTEYRFDDLMAFKPA